MLGAGGDNSNANIRVGKGMRDRVIGSSGHQVTERGK